MRFLRWLFHLNGFRISMAVAFSMSVLVFMRFPFIEIVERSAYDLKFLLRGDVPTSNQVVIAAIDEKSLDELGRWPWPRSIQGDMIKALNELGAKVIAMDVVWAEEDKASTAPFELLINKYEQMGLRNGASPRTASSALSGIAEDDDLTEDQRRAVEQAAADISRFSSVGNNAAEFYRYLLEEEGKAQTDKYLADQIAEAGNVVLGYFFYTQQAEVADLQEEDYTEGFELIKESAIKNFLTKPLGVDELRRHQRAIGVQANIPMISQAEPRLMGSFSMHPDIDGSYRYAPMFFMVEDNDGMIDLYPGLAPRAVAEYLGYDIYINIGDPGVENVELIDPDNPETGALPLPTDYYGRLWINYRGPAKTFPHYSISDIINKTVPEGAIKDKIVFVGPTATGIYDLRVTPMDEDFPGVEIHANVANDILSGDFNRSPDPVLAFVVDVLTLLLIGLIFGLTIPKLGALPGLFLTILLMSGLVVGNHLIFYEEGLILHLVYPAFGMIFIYLGITLYKYQTEEKERRKIKGAFSTYVSPAVVDVMTQNPDMLTLGGMRKDLSVLFSDIRGFTNISEKLEAEELAHLLNRYLSPMTDIVFKTEGTLDKYMGDAVMAFWGAPIDQPDHADRACNAAIDMMEELAVMQKEMAEEGLPFIDIGIGINTGPMSVGNMGSAIRFDYTVMGDAVNLGSRVEGINKDYGTNIIITEFTKAVISDHFICRRLEAVMVKGKEEPVLLYELMARGAPSPELQTHIELYEAGLDAYQNRQWDEAIAKFDEVLQRWPNDKAAAKMREQTMDYKQAPPPADWNGAFKKTTK